MATRPSPAVYRRRRIVVFGALVLVLALIVALAWFFVAQAQDKTPETAANPATGGQASAKAPESPTVSDAPMPTPEPTDSGPRACETANIDVAAVTDAESYEGAALPQLSISLTNKGASDCTINVGTTTQAFTIKSGEDVWWRSTDCQQEPSDMVVTLAAGSSVTSAEPVVWDRTRSSVETCESTERPRAPAGGASYHLSVEIGGFASATSTQILLY